MSIQIFLLRRRGYVEAQGAYCGILMTGNCIEIQTVDYAHAQDAINALNTQILHRGFNCPPQTFNGIEVRNALPSAHSLTPIKTAPTTKRGRPKKQAA